MSSVILFAGDSAVLAQTKGLGPSPTPGKNEKQEPTEDRIYWAKEVDVKAKITNPSSATFAQRPSDGMLFYAINATNGQVYKYNPATPSVASVALTSTLGASFPASFRMAFSPGGTLYYMPDSGVLYTIDQTTDVATAGPTVTGIGSGGDMAFNAGDTLYVINSSRQLYTAPLGSGAATLLGTVTFPGGITPATLGMAFDASGVMRVETQSPSNMCFSQTRTRRTTRRLTAS